MNILETRYDRKWSDSWTTYNRLLDSDLCPLIRHHADTSSLVENPRLRPVPAAAVSKPTSLVLNTGETQQMELKPDSGQLLRTLDKSLRCSCPPPGGELQQHR